MTINHYSGLRDGFEDAYNFEMVLTFIFLTLLDLPPLMMWPIVISLHRWIISLADLYRTSNKSSELSAIFFSCVKVLKHINTHLRITY